MDDLYCPGKVSKVFIILYTIYFQPSLPLQLQNDTSIMSWHLASLFAMISSVHNKEYPIMQYTLEDQVSNYTYKFSLISQIRISFASCIVGVLLTCASHWHTLSVRFYVFIFLLLKFVTWVTYHITVCITTSSDCQSQNIGRDLFSVWFVIGMLYSARTEYQDIKFSGIVSRSIQAQ